MSLRYAGVLLDLDGTLVDSAHELVASVRYALRQVDDREPPDPDTILMQVGKPLEVILGNLRYPTDQNRMNRFVQAYRTHYAEHLGEQSRLFPGTKAVLKRLCEVGVRLGLVTTKHQSQAELAVAWFGIAENFRDIRGWSEGRKHKPDAEPVLAALAELGVSPRDALMVGDSEQDILAAKAAHVDSCAVTHGFRPVLLLRSLRPDFMIPRLADLVPIVVCGLDSRY